MSKLGAARRLLTSFWPRAPLRVALPAGARSALAGPLMPFWQALRDDPRRVGAVLPSGAALAQAMLDLTLAEPPGHVIEIGAGTGAITQALVQHRQAFASLQVVESNTRLAEGLRQRFPGTAVHTCCASRLDELLAGPVERLTLVSSLPFGSLTPADRQQVLAAIARQAARSRHWRLLQYSYGGRLPFPPGGPAQGWTRLHTVWRNLPPATLWQLSPRPGIADIADPAAGPGASTAHR